MSQPASIDESVPAATPAVSVTTQPTAVDSSASSSVTAAHVPAPASAPAPAPASSSSSKSLETRSQALSGDQITYLTLMAERHKLGTLDKAARVLVNYAQKDGDQRFIFKTYRCRKCGIKFPKQSIQLALYPHQWQFLQQMHSEYAINDPELNGKPLRCLLDFTQEGRCKRGMTDQQRAEVLNALEADIFEKIRCNDPVCTHQH